jgi:hypothetical protein
VYRRKKIESRTTGIAVRASAIKKAQEKGKRNDREGMKGNKQWTYGPVSQLSRPPDRMREKYLLVEAVAKLQFCNSNR